MIQQGGQDQGSQGGMWSSQSSIWPRDPEIRTSIGQISQSKPSTDQLDQVNLNETGQSYLMVDSDGRIILARNGTNYQLAGDNQGHVPIKTDGQCGVWVQIQPNSTSSPGPSMAQMIRGQEGGQIINGMQSGPVAPPTPIAPPTYPGNGETRGAVSSRPNWSQHQQIHGTDDWYATQW